MMVRCLHGTSPLVCAGDTAHGVTHQLHTHSIVAPVHPSWPPCVLAAMIFVTALHTAHPIWIADRTRGNRSSGVRQATRRSGLKQLVIRDWSELGTRRTRRTLEAGWQGKQHGCEQVREL